MKRLERIKLSGYRSIKSMDLTLNSLNVLIGANGSGKSNLLSFFELLRQLTSRKLADHVTIWGGAQTLLHQGPNPSSEMELEIELEYGDRSLIYRAELKQTFVGSLYLFHERLMKGKKDSALEECATVSSGGGLQETEIFGGSVQNKNEADAVGEFFRSSPVYHFLNTSARAPMRMSCLIHDNISLHRDARNLAAILLRMRQDPNRTLEYRRIVETIRQIAPFFDDFVLQPTELNNEMVFLRWRERGHDTVFGPHQLSDGTLRAMALITLLLQADEDLPPLIILDEPEAGLHPYALTVIASLIKRASFHSQVILATQSTSLLNEFEPEDIVVVDRTEKSSMFKRLDPEELKEWLDDYSNSDLWDSNVVGGRPRPWFI